MSQKWFDGKAADLVRDYWLGAAVGLFGLALGLAQWFTGADTVKQWTDDTVLQAKIQRVSAHAVPWLTLGLIVSAVVNAFRGKRLSALEAECAGLRSELEAWEQDAGLLKDAHVFGIAEQLKFGTVAGVSERVTVYMHNPPTAPGKRGTFVQFGRYSSNPNFDSTRRLSYPDNEGRIAETWQRGTSFAADYPDPVTDLEAYLDRCEADGLEREQARKIRMKSRLFFGWKLMDGRNQYPLAVVIVESTSPNRYNEGYLRQVFGYMHRTLAEAVQRLGLPRTAPVRKAGM